MTAGDQTAPKKGSPNILSKKSRQLIWLVCDSLLFIWHMPLSWHIKRLIHPGCHKRIKGFKLFIRPHEDGISQYHN